MADRWVSVDHGTLQFRDEVRARQAANLEDRTTVEGVAVREVIGGPVSVKDYGAVGDGATNDSAAAESAHAAEPVVRYPEGQYAGASAYGNAYSASTYKDALGERVQAGIFGSPVADARPVLWVQKHSSADRAIRPAEWDNGAIYGALIKESGDAYGAAVTGFARHNSVDGGHIIGVHGRGLATRAESMVWGGWMYAQSIDGAAGAFAPTGLVGLEINVNHGGADTGWSAASTDGQQAALLVMAADGSNPVTHGIFIGKVNAPNGNFHHGVQVLGDAIAPVSIGTDFTSAIGDNEAILLTGRTTSTDAHTGIRFHGGNFSAGISFAETVFRSNAAMVLGSAQRIAVGGGPSSTVYAEFVNADASTRYLNLQNMLLRVNNSQVVGTRKTGWDANPTGTLTRTTYATSTVTLAGLAERVAALITDLRAHGLIGA